MTERIPKSLLLVALALFPLSLAYFAYSRPWYFTSQSYLTGLIFLEFLMVAVWMYRRFYFPVLLVTFLFAGINLPVGTGWSSARWLVLGVGAAVGLLIVLKDRIYSFGAFHVIAFFSVLTGLISSAVSAYPDVALLKVLSVSLLFLYAATGARVAAAGRENAFFRGLIVGCEILVALNAVFYALGIQAMGNPNSLGAIMSIVAAPILLWSVLLGGERLVYHRRLFLYALSLYLVFLSHARAGIGAAVFSSVALCLALKKYKLLIQGGTVFVIVLAAVALLSPDAISSVSSSVLYKNKEEGILASRVSPWQRALDNFKEHPWFGMGLGTTVSGSGVVEEQSKFASSSAVTAENGSSYLSLVVGVGIVGSVPFAILLGILVARIVRAILFMRGSGNPMHPAVPLAIVMIAGLLHAAFEDWMFAAGNYICVFFWSLAFIMNDFAPSQAISVPTLHWRPKATPVAIGGISPSP